MIKAVIFDLDDTLISEMDYVKSGYKVIAKKIKERYNLEIGEQEIYCSLMNLFDENSKNVFNRLLDEYKLSYNKDYIIELVNCYRNHIPDIKFFDDVIPCLKDLRKQNIKLGIISDGYKMTQRNKLKVLDVEKLFDKIILTDELGKDYWKPSTKAFEIIRKIFDVQYDEMVYIGDNPKKDFYIKKDCPINTIRIYRKNTVYENEQYLDNIKEDISIKDLAELEMRIIN